MSNVLYGLHDGPGGYLFDLDEKIVARVFFDDDSIEGLDRAMYATAPNESMVSPGKEAGRIDDGILLQAMNPAVR